MDVRCWGTKRRQGDMGDYQPSSLSLQIWDKGFAPRKEAHTLKRFFPGTLPHKHKHTQEKKPTHTKHVCCLPTCLLTCLNMDPIFFLISSPSVLAQPRTHKWRKGMSAWLWKLDPRGVLLRKRRYLQRWNYNSKGAKFIWHIDSYDELRSLGLWRCLLFLSETHLGSSSFIIKWTCSFLTQRPYSLHLEYIHLYPCRCSWMRLTASCRLRYCFF